MKMHPTAKGVPQPLLQKKTTDDARIIDLPIIMLENALKADFLHVPMKGRVDETIHTK